MNLKHFFANQAMWGKILGAILGYLMAGPVGILFGIIIGNFFDQGLNQHFAHPMSLYYTERNSSIKKTFCMALFSLLGHIAKADGRVSEREINATNALMHDMKLNKAQRIEAQQYFIEGKNKHFNLEQILSIIKQALVRRPDLRRLFINIQYEFAQIDGLSAQKINVMNTILTSMNFAPIHEQSRFNEDFYQYTQSSYSRKTPHSYNASSTLDQAYTILQVPSSATKNEIKKAYRKLISRNHPDKLSAQGLPADTIKQANEKTHIIRKAYEQICTSKGW